MKGNYVSQFHDGRRPVGVVTFEQVNTSLFSTKLSSQLPKLMASFSGFSGKQENHKADVGLRRSNGRILAGNGLTQCNTPEHLVQTRSQGYETVEAASGEAAVAACERNYFDLAIIDYKMPSLSGLETAEIIHGQYNIPFMFVTSSEDMRVMDKAVEHGAQSYLLKPFKPPEVLAHVRAVLSRSADPKLESSAHRNALDQRGDRYPHGAAATQPRSGFDETA